MIITYNGNIVNFNNQLINFQQVTPQPTIESFIYVGGEVVDGFGARKYDNSGNLLESYSTANRIRGLTLDSQNNLILVGDYNSISQDDNLYKFNTNGDLIFSLSTSGGPINDVITDSSDNIITANGYFNSPDFGFVSMRKYNSSGTLLWVKSHGSSLINIDVDSSDNVYVTGNRIANITTRKYNSSGTLLWSIDHGTGTNDITVDSENNVLICGGRTNVIGGINNTTRKYDTNGNLIWSVDHGTTVASIAVDSLNNVITSGTLVGGVTTRKYDSNGNLIWSINHGYVNTRSVEVDSDDNIYICANTTSLPPVLLKYNSDGELLLTIPQDNIIYDVVVGNN